VTTVALYLLLIPFGWGVCRITAWVLGCRARRR
jgi:hypothetical protein